MAVQIVDVFGNPIRGTSLRGKGATEGDTPLLVYNGGDLAVEKRRATDGAAYPNWTPADGVSNAQAGMEPYHSFGHGFNGVSWDRWRNNHEVTLLASAARTGNASVDVTNYNARGVILLVDITAVGAPAGQIDNVKFRFKGPSGSYQTVFAFSALALNTAQLKPLTVFPGITVTAGLTYNGVLPRNFAVLVEHANQVDSITYSVTAVFLV